MPVYGAADDSYEDILDSLATPGDTPGPEHDEGPHPQPDDRQEPGSTGGPGTVGPGDVTNPPGTTGGATGGSTSYASSSYSSSAGQAPTPFMRTVWAGEDVYFQLWGQYPPDGYIKALVKKGMNVYEIEEHERRKPAYKKTNNYRDEYAAFAQMVSSIMGRGRSG